MCITGPGAVTALKKKDFLKSEVHLPEKRLELADNRKSVKKRADRVVLGLSDNRLRARVTEREFKSVTHITLSLNKKSVSSYRRNA